MLIGCAALAAIPYLANRAAECLVSQWSFPIGLGSTWLRCTSATGLYSEVVYICGGGRHRQQGKNTHGQCGMSTVHIQPVYGVTYDLAVLWPWHFTRIASNQRSLVGGSIGGRAHCNGWNGINGTVSNTATIWKLRSIDSILVITMSPSSDSSTTPYVIMTFRICSCEVLFSFLAVEKRSTWWVAFSIRSPQATQLAIHHRPYHVTD